MTWYAGSVARDYASKGLLLDLSDMWTGSGACANFSDALKQLSSDESGKQIFVPTNYYWWGVFYRKSAFDKWGVKIPTTWDQFLGVCDDLKRKNVHALSIGTGSTPWVASGWFDYLDLRVNGAKFHRELLAGQHSFDSPEVHAVMDRYAELLPYFDPKGAPTPGSRPSRRSCRTRRPCILSAPSSPAPCRPTSSTTWTSSGVPIIDRLAAGRRGSAHRWVLREREDQECQGHSQTALLSRLPGLTAEVHRDRQVVQPAHLPETWTPRTSPRW